VIQHACSSQGAYDDMIHIKAKGISQALANLQLETFGSSYFVDVPKKA